MALSDGNHILFIDDVDLSDRVIAMQSETVRIGQYDRLSVTIWGHDPFPFAPYGAESLTLRASWDGGRNVLEGHVRVGSWETDQIGYHLELMGQLQRIHDPNRSVPID